MTAEATDAEDDAYNELSRRAVGLYRERRYGEALAVVRDAAPGLPHHRADVAHLAACLLALEGDATGAYAELRAAFDAGAWWHRSILEGDDDLAAARDLAGFGELVEASQQRWREAPDADRPDTVVARPQRRPRGALVVLHGAGQDGRRAAADWRAAVDAGFILVAPTSSQRSTPTYRSWPDADVGLRDVAEAVRDAAGAVAELPVLAAGYSAGGRQAVLWALSDGGPRRFVVVAPAIGAAALDAADLASAAARGVHGVALLGAEDDLLEDALAAGEALARNGVDCRSEVVDGLGHDYPGDFAARLRRWLDAQGGS